MGIGRWFRKATTIPKGNPLRKVFGRSFADELGTAGGFLVGGPAGAAAGSALGHAAADNKHATFGGMLKNAAKGYAAGTGAKMVGVPGGGGSVPGLGSIGSRLGIGGGAPAGGGMPPGVGVGGVGTGGLGAAGGGAASSGGPSLGGVLRGGGRFLRGLDDYFGDEKQGLARTQMALGGLGAYANLRGAQEEGRIADREYEMTEEERARRRRAAESYGTASYSFGG